MPTQLTHLGALEAESIHIFREVAAEFEKPVLLFSGGKDSIVMARLAEKAFWPARMPFPLMHVDTGHNFAEVLEYRDRRVEELGVQLVVASVQESIDTGRVVEETGPRASRNRLQTITLLDAIQANGFDAVFGGGRRDGMWLAVSPFITPMDDEEPVEMTVRYRTVGDASCTGAVESPAATVDDVIAEVAASRITERGATRADDRFTEAAMEDRKREGYF